MYGFHTTKIAELVAAEAARRGEEAPGATAVVAARPHRFWANADAFGPGVDEDRTFAALAGIGGPELAAIAGDRQVPGQARATAAFAAVAADDLDDDTKVELAAELFAHGVPQAVFTTANGAWYAERLVRAPRPVQLAFLAALDARYDERLMHCPTRFLVDLEGAVLDTLGALTCDEVAAIGQRSATVWHLCAAGARIDGGWMGLVPTLPHSLRAGAVLAGLIAGEDLDPKLAKRVFARISERNARRLVADPMFEMFAAACAFDAPVVSDETLVAVASSGHLSVRLIAVGLGHVPSDVDGLIAEAAVACRTSDSSDWRVGGRVPQLLACLPLTAEQVAAAVSVWPYEAWMLASRHCLATPAVVEAMLYAPVPTVAVWLAGSFATPAPAPAELARFLAEDPAVRRHAQRIAQAVAHPWGPTMEWAVELLTAHPPLARHYAATDSTKLAEALYEVFRSVDAETMAAL